MALVFIQLSRILTKFPNIRYYCIENSQACFPSKAIKNNSTSSELNSINLLLEHDDKIEPIEAAKKMTALSKIITKGDISLNEIYGHPQFKSICNILGKNCQHLSDFYLVNTLKSALYMKLSKDSYLMKSLQTSVIWKARKMSLSNLVSLFNFCNDQKDLELDEKITTEMKYIIQRRWVEIKDINEVNLLLRYHHKFQKEFLQKLEDRTIDLIEDAEAVPLTKLIATLSEVDLRTMPVLRSLSFHLCKYDGILSVKQIAIILNAMNDLSFFDQNLLDRLMSDLQPEIKEISKPSTMAAILTAMGQLRWKNRALLESCTDWMLNHMEECRVKDAVSYVLTCGNLNYTEDNGDVLDKLKLKITKDNVNSSYAWLDYVWSLAILQKAESSHLSSVLIPKFYEDIIKSNSHSIKLLNVNAAAKYDMPNLKSSVLNSDLITVTIPTNKDLVKLKLSVFDALGNFLPEGKFLNKDKDIGDGILIDAEFIMDKNMKPLPVNEYRSKLGNNPSSLKPLPYGANRVALLIWDFKDLTLNNEITGGNALIVRILQKLGYVVCEIPHYEFSLQDTILKKVQFLQKKIAESVKKKLI